MCFMKCLKLEIFQTFKNPSLQVAYLKLSDGTWNEMCYLKLLKLETFQPTTGVACLKLLWIDLKQDVLFETLGVAYLELSDETLNEHAIWNFSNPSWGLLIWNVRMRLETSCVIWNVWNFWNISWELIIWNFQMRLETNSALWNLKQFKIFKPITGSCLFETLDETSNEMCYLKLLKFLKLETLQLKLFKLQTLWQPELFETVEVPFKYKKFQFTLNLEVINLFVYRVDICC